MDLPIEKVIVLGTPTRKTLAVMAHVRGQFLSMEFRRPEQILACFEEIEVQNQAHTFIMADQVAHDAARETVSAEEYPAWIRDNKNPKIEAIKAIRSGYNLGLKEAKEYFEAILAYYNPDKVIIYYP